MEIEGVILKTDYLSVFLINVNQPESIQIMKTIYNLLIIFCFFLSCKQQPAPVSVQDIRTVPVENASFQSHQLDSTYVLYPTGIFQFGNYIILIETKSNPAFSFWNADSLIYEFSSGYKGQGPDDVIMPRPDYFYKTDSSFFILDSNIEREIRLDGKAIHIVRNTPIFIPDAINQLVRVNDSVYIMSGFNSGEGDSHIRFTTDGNYTFFGPYPPADVTEEQLTSFLYKFTAGREDKDVIIDFYQYINLIRMYTIKGELIKEIVLEGAGMRNNTYTQLFEGNIQPFFRDLQAEKGV